MDQRNDTSRPQRRSFKPEPIHVLALVIVVSLVVGTAYFELASPEVTAVGVAAAAIIGALGGRGR